MPPSSLPVDGTYGPIKRTPCPITCTLGALYLEFIPASHQVWVLLISMIGIPLTRAFYSGLLRCSPSGGRSDSWWPP